MKQFDDIRVSRNRPPMAHTITQIEDYMRQRDTAMPPCSAAHALRELVALGYTAWRQRLLTDQQCPPAEE